MRYYLKKHWKIGLLASFLIVVMSGIQIALNMMLVYMFQAIIDMSLHDFIFWSVVNTLTWIALIAVNCAQKWAESRAVCSMNNSFRADITATLLRRTHREYHAQQSGEYISWYTNDVNQIENKSWSACFQLVSTVSSVVFSLIALASFHWSLLAAAVLSGIVIVSAPKLFGKKIEKLGADMAQGQAQGTGSLKDLLMGLDVLKFFGRTDRFVAGNRAASEQIEAPKHRLNYIKGFIGGGISTINLGCQFFVNLLTGILSITGVIAQAALMGCGNFCGVVSNGFVSLGQLRLELMASKPYFEKITVHAEDIPAEVQSAAEPIRRSITVENVSYQYDEKPILRNMSVRFDKGGKYALTGPSGCGKSTLLKLLLGWLPEYTGTIRFDGKDAREFSTEQLQQQMSYIEQDVFLFNTSIRENITLGEAFTDAQLEKALKDSALDGDLASMPEGLDTVVGEEGSRLSGGQKQRVAIARALIHNRSILLVDEGTSALDQRNADIVEKSLLSNPELTLILVSHHLTDERKKQFSRVYELEAAQ